MGEIVYDLICLGAGTAGISCALRSAQLGKKVCVIEKSHIGGKNLHRGFLTRYLFHTATSIYDDLKEATQFGIQTKRKKQKLNDVKLSWNTLRRQIHNFEKQQETQTLNMLSEQGIKIIKGHGRFVSSEEIFVEGDIENTTIKANNILISTGGEYMIPQVPGFNEAITFDDVFSLTRPPKTAIVLGSQAIAAELSSILSHFDTKVALCCETPFICSEFDHEITQAAMKVLTRKGTTIYTDALFSNLQKLPSKILRLLILHKTNTNLTAEKVILADRRGHYINDLDLDTAGIELKDNEHILVDEYDATSVKNIYAIADAVNKPMLYPVAKMSGELLAERLFGKGRKEKDKYKLKCEFIPSAVHCGITMAKCGYTEKQAKSLFDKVAVYTYNGTQSLFKRPSPHILKIICHKTNKETVIGMHGIGRNVDEVISGYSIAMNKGLLKEDLERFSAISETTAEDFCNAINTKAI